MVDTTAQMAELKATGRERLFREKAFRSLLTPASERLHSIATANRLFLDDAG